MNSTTKASNKPHAVFIPFPLQGHLTPMIQLAQVLHRRGFYITFINTEFIHKRLFKASASNSLLSLPDFSFETIPDGLPPASDTATTQDLFSLCEAIRKKFIVPMRNLIVSRLPALSCIIADAQMSFSITIAQEVGVPCMLHWAASTCSFMGFKYHNQLRERGFLPVKDENLDEIIDWNISGLKDVRLRDLPLLNVTKYDFPKKEVEEAFKASGIIFNTFEALDQDVLNAISSMFPHIYAVGPTLMLVKSTSNDNDKLKSNIGSNLLEEEPECLQWLNSMKPNSVVYISFGSLAELGLHQFVEFAWGILNSNCPFLWIIRPNLVNNGPALPPELLAKVKERGFIAAWCSQEQVLNHPSIGGFLTHSGWNSTLESICAGVPMICWPYYGDHQINCRYSCTSWGIGMEIDHDVKRDQVEKLVRELMKGEQGKKLKKNAMEWKKLAVEATSENGSTFMNLEKLIHDCLTIK